MKLIEETKVEYATAMLSKEKGFDIPPESYCSTRKNSSGKNILTESEGYQTDRIEISNWNNGLGSYPTEPSEVKCSAPTQDLLQKFLREKHLVDITVITNWINGKRVYYCGISYVNKEKNQIDIWFSKDDKANKVNYKTYEEAREVGLFKGVTII